MNATPAALRPDGRRLRSERTRLAIIEGYLALLRRSSRMPTAAEIAAEAGYSVRSIFERFTDLNALSLATADYAIEQGQAEAAAYDVEGGRSARIESHISTRAKACEKWLPLWRILIATQDQLADLEVRVKAARFSNIARMQLMYAAELSTLEAAAREQLLMALATLISFETWDQLRHCYGLSEQGAQEVLRSTIDRLLPPAAGASVSPQPR